MALTYAIDTAAGETPETIAKRREVANLMAARLFSRAPQNVGEGINAIGQALIARSMSGDADAAQKAGLAGGSALGASLFPAVGAAASIAGQPVTPSAAVASSPMGDIPPPAAPTTGKIYNNDEPSPLDPPSGQDRQAMIATILGEAGNQGPTGMNAVGSVIRNRAVSGSFGGDTPAGVVTAKNQFEPWNTPEGRARMARAAADPRQAAAADAAISAAYGEGGQAPNDPTNGATMFFDPKLQASLGRQVPPWAQGPGQDIGDHRFFGGAPAQPVMVADAGNSIPPAPIMTGGIIGNAPPDQRQAMAFAQPTAPQPLAGPAGAPPASVADDSGAALPPNAQPTGGALPTAQAVQSATQPQPNPRLLQLQQAIGDPRFAFLTKGQQAAAMTEYKTLFEQAQKQSDPAAQVALENAKLQGQKLQADLKEKKTIVVNGRLVDAQTGELVKDYSDLGKTPEGYKAVRDGNGDVVAMQPLPGSEADTKNKAAQQKQAQQKEAQNRYGDIVTQDIDRALKGIDSASLPVTGAIGSMTSNIPGTASHDVSALLSTIKANIGFDRLQQMRASSPTGGALGQVSDFENKLLQATIGNLEQSQSKMQLKQNLNRVYNTYMDIIHGPGNGPARRPLDGVAPSATPDRSAIEAEMKRRGLL